MHNKKILSKMALSMFLIGIMSAGVYADSVKYVDISGKDRYETSTKAAKLVKSDTVILASGKNYADSLSAYNIASSKHAKLILVNEKTDLEKELKDQNIKKVYIVGGSSVISSELENKVKKIVPNTMRLAGKNRYETNKMTLKESGVKSVGVADGRNFPDALSASGLLMNKHLGLMLVDGSKPYKTEFKVEYTFGGKNSVMQDGGKRIAGKNRYETSLGIAKSMGKLDSVVVTTGKDFPDALGAVNLLNINITKVTPIIIVSDSLSPEAKEIISSVQEKYLLGGALGEKIKVEINGKVTVGNTGNSSSSRGSSSRGSSSVSQKLVINPEVEEIKALYAKSHKDRGIDDEYSPSNVSKLLDNQKIKGIKEIASASSPQEAVDQYIYNNFFAVNSMIDDLKASDLPRFKKAIEDYKKLPDPAKKILDKMDMSNISEASKPENKNKTNVIFFGKKELMGDFGNNIVLDTYLGDVEYYRNTSSLFLPYDSRNIITNDNVYSEIFNMLLKTAYLENLNNLNPSPQEMASKYKKLYSGLLNLRPEDINNENCKKIFMEVYDYNHLTDEAKNLVKDEHDKIEKLISDSLKSFNTAYKTNAERHGFEQNFKSKIYTLKAQKNKGVAYFEGGEGILGHGGKTVLNSPSVSEKGTDGIIYRFKNIEYTTVGEENIKINLTMTNDTNKEIDLNGEIPFISSRIDIPEKYESNAIFKNDSDAIRIAPKSTVEVSFSAKLDSDLMADLVESVKHPLYRVGQGSEQREKEESASDALDLTLYDSKGHVVVGGVFFSGKSNDGEKNPDIKGVTVDGKELIDIVKPIYKVVE